MGSPHPPPSICKHNARPNGPGRHSYVSKRFESNSYALKQTLDGLRNPAYISRGVEGAQPPDLQTQRSPDGCGRAKKSFDSSLRIARPRKSGGLPPPPPSPPLQTQRSHDGFGKGQFKRFCKAKHQKLGAWGVATICKQNARTMGLEGIHTVLEASLHVLNPGGWEGALPFANTRKIGLEGNHVL